MLRSALALIALVSSASLVACATESAPIPAPAPGSETPAEGSETPTESTEPTEPAPAPAPTTPPAPAAAPKAPKLTQLMKMSGSLHVMWTNAQDDCDAIVAERKTAKTDYKVAFTVPGMVDNKHDGSANGAETYTYRLRCKKGETFSAYSNEMSGSPK